MLGDRLQIGGGLHACEGGGLTCAAEHSTGSHCTLTLNTLDWLTVPAVTMFPSRLSTGTDSPVSIDSSTDELPARTSPSTGTRPPGLTRISSPSVCELDGGGQHAGQVGGVGCVAVDAPGLDALG